MSSLNRKMEFNLRNQGIGISFDRKNLYLTAIRSNSMGQITYKGYEVLENYEEQTDDQIIEFLEEFKSNHDVKRGDAFLAIPRSQAMIRIAEFPAEAADNLEEVMEYQLDNYFAGDLDDRDFFPQIIHRGDQLKVMIVAVKKELLGHAYGFIRRWKLKLTGVALDTFTLVNGLSRTEPERFADSKFMVIRPSIGGLEMISVDQGKLTSSTYFDINDVEDVSYLVENLEQGFSNARLEPNEVDHYLWSGDTFPEIRRYLAEEISIPFEAQVDITGVTIDDAALPGFGAAVTSVLDRPLLEMNMLPDNLRKRQKRLPVILASVAAVLFLIFAGVSQYMEYTTLGEELDQVTVKYDRLMEQMAEVSSARSQKESREEELRMFREYQTSNLLMKVLAQMATQLPEDTYLTHVQIKQGQEVTFQGESDDPFKIQRILSAIPFLKDVKTGNAITAGRNRDGKRRFMYKAQLDLEALR